MTLWKHLLVLFGGFIDTGARTTYLNDLWIFDTTEYKWYEMKQNDLRRPLARSGFSFLTCPDGLILHGGYCKRYVKGQRTQGVALDDTWILKFEFNSESNSTLNNSKNNSGSLLPTIDWQKRRKIGYFPNPTRSGCTMANWNNKNMAVLFGGVTDTENDEESLESTCHKELYAYQMNGNGRWISLNLKRKKVMGGGRRRKKNPSTTVNQTQQRRGGEDSDDENEDGEKESGDEDEEKIDDQSKVSSLLGCALFLSERNNFVDRCFSALIFWIQFRTGETSDSTFDYRFGRLHRSRRSSKDDTSRTLQCNASSSEKHSLRLWWDPRDSKSRIHFG